MRASMIPIIASASYYLDSLSSLFGFFDQRMIVIMVKCKCNNTTLNSLFPYIICVQASRSLEAGGDHDARQRRIMLEAIQKVRNGDFQSFQGLRSSLSFGWGVMHLTRAKEEPSCFIQDLPGRKTGLAP